MCLMICFYIGKFSVWLQLFGHDQLVLKLHGIHCNSKSIHGGVSMHEHLTHHFLHCLHVKVANCLDERILLFPLPGA